MTKRFKLDGFTNQITTSTLRPIENQSRSMFKRCFLEECFHLCSSLLQLTPKRCTEMPWIGHSKRWAFFAIGEVTRLFDRLNVTATVYSQLANTILNEVVESLEHCFSTRLVEIAGKLEFQTRNTQHHHILLFLQGAVIDHLDQIDDIISAQLPTAYSLAGQSVLDLVKKLNTHCHLPCCRGRTWNLHCQFGYDTNEINPSMYTDETFSWVVYTRKKVEYLKVVLYNAEYIRMPQGCITFKQTQGELWPIWWSKRSSRPYLPMCRWVRVRKDNRQPEVQRRITFKMTFACTWEQDLLHLWRLLAACSRYIMWKEIIRLLPTRYTWKSKEILSSTPAVNQTTSVIRCCWETLDIRHTIKVCRFWSIWSSSICWISFPRPLLLPQAFIPLVTASPAYFMMPWRSTDEKFSVSRIPFVPSGKSELFWLQFILLEQQVNLFANGKTWERRQYSTFCKAAVALGLKRDGNEF